MQYQLFQYAVPVDDTSLEELNRFLSSNRITSVSRSTVERHGQPFLLFVVEYGGDAPKPTSAGSRPERAKTQEEYKARLGDRYEIFNRLRDARKGIAEQAGVQVYNVFTNDQLIEMMIIASDLSPCVFTSLT